MGVFDYLRCEHPLPDGFDPSGVDFQTKDTPAQRLETYVIREDGTLFDEWREEEVPFHGCLDFYASNYCASGPEGFATDRDEPPWSASYQALYDRGKLIRIDGERTMDNTERWMPIDDLIRLWQEKRDAREPKESGS